MRFFYIDISSKKLLFSVEAVSVQDADEKFKQEVRRDPFDGKTALTTSEWCEGNDPT